MTNDEIIETLEKLKYQVRILGEAVDYTNFPIQSLIMSYDWGPGDIDKAHDIFERWEKHLEGGGNMDTGDFEADFNKEFSITYQGLKSIVLAFYENGQWTNVCEAYVDAFGKYPSMEYHSIARRKR